jgi:hypothetical protein
MKIIGKISSTNEYSHFGRWGVPNWKMLLRFFRPSLRILRRGVRNGLFFIAIGFTNAHAAEIAADIIRA